MTWIRTRFRLPPALDLLVFCLAHAVCAGPTVAGAEATLTTALQVHELPPSDADLPHRVQLTAVVTFSDPRNKDLVIQDRTGGIYVRCPADCVDLQAGQLVEMEGITASGHFAPVLIETRTRIIRPAVLPMPRKATFATLSSGRLVSEWVEIEGVARAAAIEDGHGSIEIAMPDGRLKAPVLGAHLEDTGAPAKLAGLRDGSQLRLTGICVLRGGGGEGSIGPALRLRLRSAGDIQVLARPSWWTLSRTLTALGAVAVAIPLCLVWAFLLRMRMRAQTAILRQKLEREAALELRYRDLFENAQDIVYTVDLSMNFTSLNPAGERVTGYSREEALGMNARRFIAPSHLARQQRIWNKVLSGQTPKPFEVAVIAKDGRRLTLELTAHMIYQDGIPIGVEGIGRDITSRKKAERALRESEERYRRLFDSNPLPALVYDCEITGILAVNEAVIRQYGYSREEMLAMRLADFSPPEEVPALLRHFATRQRSSVSGPWRHRRKDGSLFLAEVTSHEITFEGRTARLSLIRDVTERQRVETEMARNARELEEARRVAENAAKIKSQFLATMSHEIRTPMNGVIGMTHLLLDTPLDGTQRECAETIRGSAESLLTIINDILDFSKIEAGKMTVELIPFHPRQALEEALDLLALQAKEKKLELRLDYDSSIPNELVGDAGRIRQIVLNLAGNAVKFTSQGEVVVRVTAVEAGPEGHGARLRFEVADTGPGIPESKRGLMFQSFTQADASTTRRFGGTGLGLAISRQLVELMGGRIGVESVEGQGSTFWFELTLAGREPEEQPTASPPVEPDSAAADLINLRYRVLVAEDNVVNQRVAASILRKYGCRMDVAANGREAVDLWEKLPYDLVLMDCQMPEMDGYEATAEIRRRESGGRRTPIVAMTANVMQGDREECLTAGMDDYIAKPVSQQQLRNALLRWAARSVNSV